MDTTYIYNVTISADRSCSADVRYYVEHRLFPTWAKREGWGNAKLLLVPTDPADGVSLALQFETDSKEVLSAYPLEEDPLVTRITEVYGERVYFYPTLMERIETLWLE